MKNRNNLHVFIVQFPKPPFYKWTILTYKGNYEYLKLKCKLSEPQISIFHFSINV